MKDYEATFKKFWEEMVTFPDGTLDKDAIMRELHDYHVVLQEVPKVYNEVTGGKINMADTHHSDVIDAIEAFYYKYDDDDRAD